MLTIYAVIAKKEQGGGFTWRGSDFSILFAKTKDTAVKVVFIIDMILYICKN